MQGCSANPQDTTPNTMHRTSQHLPNVKHPIMTCLIQDQALTVSCQRRHALLLLLSICCVLLNKLLIMPAPTL